MLRKTSIDGIQYLRAIAALMVVAHHARHYFGDVADWTGFGARGVDVFFVISGFVMALSTERYTASGPRLRQASDFMVNRIVRVVPLYWLALLWTYKQGGEPLPRLLMDFAFLPRWNATEAMVAPGFVPGWTINYEMLFYGLFAVSMLFGRRRFVVLAGVLLGMAALGVLAWQAPAALFLTSSIVLEFLMGIAVFFACRAGRPVAPRWLLAVLGSASLAAMAHDSAWPRGLYYGPLAAVVVFAGVTLWQGRRIALLRALGDASYSIYLFHISTFHLTARICHALGLAQRTPSTIATVIALHVVVAAAGGVLMHRAVERPLIALVRRLFRRTPAGATPASSLAP